MVSCGKQSSAFYANYLDPACRARIVKKGSCKTDSVTWFLMDNGFSQPHFYCCFILILHSLTDTLLNVSSSVHLAGDLVKFKWVSVEDILTVSVSQWSYYRMANLTPLSHSNATLAPQTRQARASGENLNYSHAQQKWNFFFWSYFSGIFFIKSQYLDEFWNPHVKSYSKLTLEA